MLVLLVFIIPFSGCKNVCISYPKAYWLKKVSFDSVLFLKESYNFLCSEYLGVVLNLMTNGCRQLLLRYHSTKRCVNTEIQVALYHLKTSCGIKNQPITLLGKLNFHKHFIFTSVTYTVFEKYTVPVLCVVWSIHCSSFDR